MKALFDYIPLIIFFVLYKTTEPTDSTHPILQLIGSAGTDNNHILVATFGLIAAKAAVVCVTDDGGFWWNHLST